MTLNTHCTEVKNKKGYASIPLIACTAFYWETFTFYSVLKFLNTEVVHLVKKCSEDVLIIKPTRCTDFSNLFLE